MRLSVVSVLVMVFSTILCAQDSTNVSPNALQAGKWAVQFQIGSNFQLTSFNGATIALKHQSSSTFAQRLALTLSGTFLDGETGTNNQPPPYYYYSRDTSTRRNTISNEQENIVLSYSWISYLVEGGDIHPYIGFGPMVGYANDVRDTSVLYQAPRNWSLNKTNWKNSTVSVGGILYLGAEWFASRSISITAEYSASLTYSSTTSSMNGSYHVHTDGYSPDGDWLWSGDGNSHAFTFSGNTVRFGLSAYF